MMPHIPVLGNLSPLIPAGSDVEATLAFYVHKLGFTTIHKDGEPTEMAIIQRDAVEIFLCRNDDRYVAEQTSFRIHVHTSSNSMASIRHRASFIPMVS